MLNDETVLAQYAINPLNYTVLGYYTKTPVSQQIV